jgi:hypothetical protein
VSQTFPQGFFQTVTADCWFAGCRALSLSFALSTRRWSYWIYHLGDGGRRSWPSEISEMPLAECSSYHYINVLLSLKNVCNLCSVWVNNSSHSRQGCESRALPESVWYCREFM